MGRDERKNNTTVTNETVSTDTSKIEENTETNVQDTSNVEDVKEVPTTEVKSEVTSTDTDVQTTPFVPITSLNELYKELHKIDKESITDTLVRCTIDDAADSLFVSELKDINKYLLLDTNEDINKANLRLNALILTILKTNNEMRFNILNILFKLDNVRYEPSYLLRIISFTKNGAVIQNYSQLITIIETLANPSTRKNRKASVSNLNYLTIDAESKNFLKQYYKM